MGVDIYHSLVVGVLDLVRGSRKEVLARAKRDLGDILTNQAFKLLLLVKWATTHSAFGQQPIRLVVRLTLSLGCALLLVNIWPLSAAATTRHCRWIRIGVTMAVRQARVKSVLRSQRHLGFEALLVTILRRPQVVLQGRIRLPLLQCWVWSLMVIWLIRVRHTR